MHVSKASGRVGEDSITMRIRGKRSHQLTRYFRAAIRHTAFSHDGELVAMGGDDPFIAIVSTLQRSSLDDTPSSLRALLLFAG